MFTHEQIWRGIDRLAALAQTSPSGLARRAGLDATTFNPSKRFSRDGEKPRWPSTESLAKALAAANMSFNEFAQLVAGKTGGPGLRLRGLADGPQSDAFDATGMPRGEGWSQMAFPALSSEDAFALTVEDMSMAPVYRPGDRLIVDREDRPRRGDRIVVKFRDGQLKAFELGESNVQEVELKPLMPDAASRRVPLVDIAWLARIVWVSQ